MQTLTEGCRSSFVVGHAECRPQLSERPEHFGVAVFSGNERRGAAIRRGQVEVCLIHVQS